MQTPKQNKMIGNDTPNLNTKNTGRKATAGDQVKEFEQKSVFSFPALGISVEAETYEEAVKKMKDLINKK